MSAPAVSNATCSTCGATRTPGTRFCIRCGKSFVAVPPAGKGKLEGLGQRFRLRGDGNDLLYVLAAAALAVLLSYLPFIGAVAYPFKLFGTFVHEWCHAVVAIATGGDVTKLQIHQDLSGETYTRGGWMLLIASAGYVGAALSGALLLLAPTRFAKRTLMAVGAGSLLMPLIGGISFGTDFPADTWIWTLLFGVGTLAVGIWAAPRLARVFQQFVAVELCFTAINSLKDLITITLSTPMRSSDALNAQNASGLPETFWAALWTALAVVSIGYALLRVVRRTLA